MEPAKKLDPTEKPRTQKFSLRTPYMKQGRITQLVAETENMWIHQISWWGGQSTTGEPFVYRPQRPNGRFGREGQRDQKHQGVMIPKGTYYRYHNTGENLVVLRVTPASGQARQH
jgi:hypothetical protein